MTKLEHCCKEMNETIISDEQTIEYSNISRSYSIRINRISLGTNQSIYYCPWCGAKLPKRLGDSSFKKDGNLTSEWDDALYDTCGL